MNFLALAMSKQCFLFSFKITSIMVEWITLIQNVAHLLYILNSYFFKEMYSKFTFYFLLELNLLLIPQSVFSKVVRFLFIMGHSINAISDNHVCFL